MAGCGVFSEIDFLLFQEGRLPAGHPLREHLNTCGPCLEESLELTRVGAVMEHSAPDPDLKPLPLIKLRALAGRLKEFFAIGGSSDALAPVETRRPDNSQIEGVKTFFPEYSLEMTIYAIDDGTFWLEAASPRMAGTVVELRHLETRRLVYSRSTADKQLQVKGLAAGAYEFKFHHHTIILNLDNNGADHESD